MWLAARLIVVGDARPSRRSLALALYAAPLALVAGAWFVVFWRW